LQGGDGKGKKSMGQMSELLLKAEVENTAAASGHHWIWSLVTVVFIICLLMVLVKLIKQMRRDKKLNQEEDEWTEITEQSEPSKRNNLLSFFKNLNPLGKRKNVDPIRLSYLDFLKQYAELAKSYPANSTTRDMRKKASESFAVNEEELMNLTKIYEDHRYGGKPVDSHSVQSMKAAVGNWLKKE
jgi:flagellar biosynthesis/type III secretory pathway M-ring protein FliF/YscJ